MRLAAPLAPTLCLATLALLPATPVSAQPSGGRAMVPQELRPYRSAPNRGGEDLMRAEEVRNQLQEVLRQYPPSLAGVLRLDPTLLTNEDYLASYPSLAAFLQDHPEIARSPAYYLGRGDLPFTLQEQPPLDAEAQLRREAMGVFRNTMETLTVLGVVVAVALALAWLIRFFVGHRRWLRTTKLQSEVHGKLLERLTSNEELMAYMESPAGRQFLTATTPVADLTVPASAPLSRILLSVQVGMVLLAAGIGMLFVRRFVPEFLSAPLILGVMGIALGLGFVLAAAASYILSQRLGLLDTSPSRRSDAPSV
jgi:hypothetical protein